MPVSGRHNGQVVESFLSPAQKRVALFVAQEFQLSIKSKRLRGAEFVHLHRVVDDKLCRLQGIDQLGVAAQPLHGIAHRGQIDHSGNAREVLEEYAAGRKSDFLVRLRLAVPPRERAYFRFGHVAAVFGTQQVLEQNAQRVGQMLRRDALAVERVQPVDRVFFAKNAERRATVKTVHITISLVVLWEIA